MTYRYMIFMFFCGHLMGCDKPKKSIEITEIVSEKYIEFEEDNVTFKEFFAVSNRPENIATFRALIDKNILRSLNKINHENYFFTKYFYQANDRINKNFKPYFDEWCITNCGDGVHIWDAGYNDRLASVSISRDPCQLYIVYRFYHTGWLWWEGKEERFSSRKIFDKTACKKIYGMVPNDK